jgi:tetratricopeptide (TPR) repeat protein
MQALERLREAIKSPAWNRKITYFQALTESIANDNDTAARREFDKLLPVSEAEDDVDPLQLYFALYSETFGFAKTIAVCDQIIRAEDTLANQLQYGSAKAIRHFLIGDGQHARAEFDRIVELARAAQQEGDLSEYETWQMALAISFLGVLTHEAKLFDEAIAILETQLASGDWKPSGLSNLQRQVADNHRHAERWQQAEAAYRAAIAAAPSTAAAIFLAEVVMLQGRTAEAAGILDQLEPATFDRSEHEDFAFVSAAIAVELSDRHRMQVAARYLEGFEGSAPYFERRRLVFLLRVHQALRTGSTPKIKRSLRRWLADSARGLSRYLILEPNVVGLGFNLNAMLNDLADRIDDRLSMASDGNGGAGGIQER